MLKSVRFTPQSRHYSVDFPNSQFCWSLNAFAHPHRAKAALEGSLSDLASIHCRNPSGRRMLGAAALKAFPREAMSPTHDELLALLDYRSEQEIETNLAKGIYGPDKRSLAELVLARKKLARMEAERAAEIEVTRKATEAAWENTKAARDAVRRATWAILISIASLAIAVATAMF
jgi:hypothetical protein